MSPVPSVSLGLPVYNGEQYLEQAIGSLLGQTFGDFELLIGDNGSTDATYEIAQRAALVDRRVRVHRSETNRGAAWNFNRLVELARGKYFKWAAHDDVLAPEYLERCVAVLDEDPGVSLVYTRAAGVDEAGRVVRTIHLPPYATQAGAVARAASVLLHPSPCLEAFGLSRREQLLSTGLIGAYTSSDRTLILELSLRGRFVEVPETLFYSRQHPRRSVRRYADARERNLWFDPAWSGRRSAPRWRLLREYGRAVTRADVDGKQKVGAAAVLVVWSARHRRGLVHDAAAVMAGRARAAAGRGAGAVLT